MKVSIKSKYEGGASGESATATLSLSHADLKLKASLSDSTFRSGPSLSGLSLGLEKPGSFIIDHDLSSASTRFQFMSAATLAGRQLKLTYIHPQKRNATVVEGTLSLDSRNKLTGKYSFASGKAQVKYSYVHAPSDLTLEPWYDFGTESWNFSASKKVAGGKSTVKAVYESHHKVLGVEWVNEDKRLGGGFKVAATLNMENEKPPKVLLEKTWNCEL